MMDFQKMGGAAALFGAAKIVFGIGLILTLLAPTGWGTGDVDPDEFVAFLVDNQGIMYIWKLTIFVVFAVFLVVLVLALYERLKASSSAMVLTATAFGLIWAGLEIAGGMVATVGLGTVVDLYAKDPALAASVWLALDSVENALGGGNEIVGSLWILLISWAALRAGGLPRALNYFGVIVSVAGLTTVIPALGQLGVIFGLGLIVWFGWLGVVMLRSRPGAAA